MNQINQLKNKIEFNEARFEAVAQTASDVIVISDENSIIVFANKKTYEIFGYPQGSLIGSDLGILMPEKYRQGHRAGVRRFVDTGKPKLIGHTIEIEGLRRDDSIFPLELSLSAWKEEGKYFFSGIIRDITERKKAIEEKEEINKQLQEQQEELEAANEELQAANQELHEAKHLLQEITDAVPNLIYINDFTAKKNIFVNKEIGALTGYTSEDAKSFEKDSFLQQVHPEDLSIVYDREKAYENLRKGELYEVTIRLKHKNGNWRWLRTKSKVFKYDEKGKPLQILGVTEDVTEAIEAQQTIQQQNEELAAALEELQTAEEQLREMNEELENRVDRRTRELAESERNVKQSEEQLRLITDAMPVLISYKGSDLTYRFVNKTYEKYFKLRREDIVGKSILEVVGTETYKKVLPVFNRILKGDHVDSEILQLEIGEFGKRWVRFSVLPHKIEGNVVGMFNLVEDITKFKDIQLELEEKNHELERTNKDLDNFIYTASHDLKSPITNMQGLMMLLKNSALEKIELKERNMLDMMDASIQRLQKTIGDLVEVTKVHKELEEAVEENVRFEELSRDVKDDIYNLIQESNATIKEDYKVEEIIYKKSSLRSILYNLLSNAMKYRSPDKPLEVELKTFIQDDSVVLSVKDNGLGLSPKQQQKLFTLFKRMHQHVEGTGVGLFMIKRIIENNRGRIEVKSDEGKGTEFFVFLEKASKNKNSNEESGS